MYIDIHTHNALENTDTLSILNVYKDFDKLPERPCSVGLHPWYLQDVAACMELMHWQATNTHVLAIGECGLDKVCTTDWNIQIAAFTAQIHLANESGKPLIIHCVRAFEELIQVLKHHPSQVPVIIHGYNKKLQVAERLLREGYYLAFGAALLHDDSPAADVISIVPDGRFFLETDSADVAIADIYLKAAALRKTTPDVLILQIENNFKKVFRT